MRPSRSSAFLVLRPPLRFADELGRQTDRYLGPRRRRKATGGRRSPGGGCDAEACQEIATSVRARHFPISSMKSGGGMIARQALSFALIGVLLNAALYVAYLVLTHTVFDDFVAMTVTYCSGVVMGFMLNRRFTFAFGGEGSAAFVRYVCAYVLGYFINFFGLWLLARNLGIPHEIVQGWMILGIAVLLFLLQKYWVFKNQLRNGPAPYISSGQ